MEFGCVCYCSFFMLYTDIYSHAIYAYILNQYSLRDEVLHLIARVKLSKYEIAQRIFKHGACGEVESLGDLDYLNSRMRTCCTHPMTRPTQTSSLNYNALNQCNKIGNRGIIRCVNLYPPGNITHLVKTGQSKQSLHGVVGCITCGASNAGSI